MTNTDASERELVTIIQRFLGGRNTIARSTSILHDLHIAGDDACELIEEIAKRFGVSFAGYGFDSYFPGEYRALGAFWASKLGFRYKQRRLTVAHLLAVIERGEWFEPDPSNWDTTRGFV